jgi:hypothetical protein
VVYNSAEKLAPNNELLRQLAIIAHRTDFPDSVKFPLLPFNRIDIILSGIS